MKQRLNKLLAIVLSAALCVPMLPAGMVKAADAGVVFTDEEQMFVNDYGKERTTNINDRWKFYFGSLSGAYGVEFNDAEWDYVDLPHDFSITQEFTADGERESGFLLGGTGWYRKHFTLSDELAGKRVLLNFDGVYSHATVYVNGNRIGEHHYGYTPFAFDITDYVKCDSATDNVIAVEAVHNFPSSRWYSGSGIYRDVTLIVTNPVHVAKDGTFVTTPNLGKSNGSDGTVNVAVDVQNDSSAEANVTVRNTVYEKGSTEAKAQQTGTVKVAAGAVENIAMDVKVDSPKLWSPETPNLYYVRTEILNGNETLDTYDTEFGFKWYEFVDNEGFKLNGKNVKINGVCLHHDQGALGAAAYHDAIYRQLSIMKDMGVNTIRITHNPGAEVFVDVCNEIGLLVIEEFFDGWAWAKNSNPYDFSTHFTKNLTESNQIIGGDSSMTWAEFVLKATVKRDRNDASIILWSLGNEIDEGSGGGPWDKHADNLIQWTQEVDMTHPVTSGSNRRWLSTDGDTGVPIVNQKIYEKGGVVGYNYGDLNSMNTLHGRYPVMLWSETASAVNSRGVYTSNSTGTGAAGGHLTSYDESCVGWGKTAHASMYPTLTNDYIAGECVWTGFDYIGEPTPWNGDRGIHPNAPNRSIPAPNSSYFGIVETSGFPKDNYYLYRSQWNQSENTVHMVTAWDADNQKLSNGKTPVWVYSNAAKVELWKGNKKIGTATRKPLSQTTTAAGHVHYEYTTESHDQSVCTTSSGNGDQSLYAVFNVAYEAGTISAKAFDDTGAEITESCAGRKTITTPGAPAKLSVEVDKEEILADGSSLAYISVDVTDADGNFDTAANNEITFKLTGNGEILGVDNGDQATVEKFQQPSVIESKTSAKIKAYAGKALAIVRSTTKAGGFQVAVASNGLIGETVNVQTKLPEGQSENAIESYLIQKHCYVPVNTPSIALPEKISVTRADGTQEQMNVSWEAYDRAKLQTAGTFVIKGKIGIGVDETNVSITVHVYGDIAAAKNIAGYTAQNVLPTLPTALMTYSADGNEFEEFPVTWDMKGLQESDFAEIGTKVKINGTVDARKLIGKTFAVTASIRVAEAREAETTNISPVASELTQNCSPVADNLGTVKDENRYGDQASDTLRWTDWNDNRADKDTNPPAITMKWDTVHSVDEIRLYYAIPINGIAKPSEVTIQLSSDGENFTTVEYETPTTVIPAVSETPRATEGEIFKLKEKTTPIAVRVILKRNGASKVGLTEIEVMSKQYTYESFNSADLSGISVDGTAVEGFAANKTDYVVSNLGEVTVGESDKNVAATVLPEYNGAVTIFTVSEDGSAAKKYTVSRGAQEAEKKEFSDFLEEMAKIDSSKYTPETYQKLMNKVAELKKVSLENISVKELQAMKKELEDAQKALVTKPVVKPEPKPEPKPDPKPEPKPDPKPDPKPNPNPAPKKGDVIKGDIGRYKVLDANKKTATLIAVNNEKASKLNVPATVKLNKVTFKVVQVGDKVMSGNTKLKKVVLGNNVTTIGKQAFMGCKNLKSVQLKGKALKNIKSGAFKKTSAKLVVSAKKMSKKDKAKLLKKLKKAGAGKKTKVK